MLHEHMNGRPSCRKDSNLGMQDTGAATGAAKVSTVFEFRLETSIVVDLSYHIVTHAASA